VKAGVLQDLAVHDATQPLPLTFVTLQMAKEKMRASSQDTGHAGQRQNQMKINNEKKTEERHNLVNN
jgi:hypothetical protein